MVLIVLSTEHAFFWIFISSVAGFKVSSHLTFVYGLPSKFNLAPIGSETNVDLKREQNIRRHLD